MDADPMTQAVALHQAGKLREAETLYRQVLAAQPRHADALNMLGVLAAQVGQLAPAEQLIRQSLAIRPSADGLNNLGNVLRFAGRLNESADAYRTAAQLNPKDTKIYANLGTVLGQLGRHEEAVAAYQRLLTLDPAYAQGHSNLGNELHQLGRTDDAIKSLGRAIELQPQWPEAYVNLSDVLRSVGRLEESVAAASKAAELRPEMAEGRINLGNALISQGRVEEAIAAYREAIELKPRLHHAHSNLLLALHNREEDPQVLFAEHQHWAREHAGELDAQVKPLAIDRTPDRPLRIGYVSPDLRDHPVGRFMLPILEHHDRSRFEIVCYSGAARPDDVTRELQSYGDGWHDVAALADASLDAMIRQQRIDILVDLAGHTSGGRMLVFAHRPAPVQVTYLGYPDTSGLKAIDYRISDAIADGTDEFNVEKVVRANPCFVCLRIGNQPALDRPGDGLASLAPLRFGCFNNYTKVSPHVLRLWARILDAVPEARLLLRSRGLNDPPTAARVREMLARHSVPAERVDLLGHDQANPLARYNEIDVALDTFPYSGTATTCDALSMGVPVITLAGRTHASRVSASLLAAAGLANCVAHDDDAYVRLALEAAKQGRRTVEHRRALREQVRASPLCDAATFVRRLEDAYRRMWLDCLKI